MPPNTGSYTLTYRSSSVRLLHLIAIDAVDVKPLSGQLVVPWNSPPTVHVQCTTIQLEPSSTVSRGTTSMIAISYHPHDHDGIRYYYRGTQIYLRVHPCVRNFVFRISALSNLSSKCSSGFLTDRQVKPVPLSGNISTDRMV